DTAKRIIRGGFEAEDIWFVTGDILRQDEDGDYWYVDRASEMIRTVTGPLATTEIEDALYAVPEVGLAVAYAIPVPGTTWQMPAAAVVPLEGRQLDPGELLDILERTLPLRARPRFIRARTQIAMTDGYRPIKSPLIDAGIRVRSNERTYWYDSVRHKYEELDQTGYMEAVRQAGGTPDERDLEEESAG